MRTLLGLLLTAALSAAAADSSSVESFCREAFSTLEKLHETSERAQATGLLDDLQGALRLARGETGTGPWHARLAGAEAALANRGGRDTLAVLREAAFAVRYGGSLDRAKAGDLEAFFRAEQAVNAYLDRPRPALPPVPKLPHEEKGKHAGTTTTEIFEVGHEPQAEQRTLHAGAEPADRDDPAIQVLLAKALEAASVLDDEQLEAVVRLGERRPPVPGGVLAFTLFLSPELAPLNGGFANKRLLRVRIDGRREERVRLERNRKVLLEQTRARQDRSCLYWMAVPVRVAPR